MELLKSVCYLLLTIFGVVSVQGTGQCPTKQLKFCGSDDHCEGDHVCCALGRSEYVVCMDPDPCKLDVKSDNCTEESKCWKGYHFDRKGKQCSKFQLLNGNKGNANNFQTIDDCRHRCCKIHPCFHSKSRCPRIDKKKLHYYYNALKGKCKRLSIYGECGGTKNRFDTQDDCERRCKTEKIKKLAPCYQKLDIGNVCESNKGGERWAYEPCKGRCVQFYYKGCGGTKNTFATKNECEKLCK